MNNIKVKVYKKEGVQLPEYATLGASACDVRALIGNENDLLIIGSGETKMVHTGIFMEIPKGYEVQVRPRSGLAIKHGITVTNSPGTIDSDYRGECNVILTNLGESAFIIRNGERIGQFVINPTYRIDWEEVADKDDLDSSNRGEGGFGHTGRS